jgi:hypothetical protein
MLHCIIWAVLATESMTAAFLPSVLNLLLKSSLQGCGVCAICSICFNNCAPGNLGFDQDVSITQLCTQPTDTPGFWGCVCTERSLSLVDIVSSSLAVCPVTAGTNPPNIVLAEFSVIRLQLGFTPVNFTDISGTSSISLPLPTSLLSSQSGSSFPTGLTTSDLNLETTTGLQPSATASLQST